MELENEAGPCTLAVGLVLLSEQCEVTKTQNKTKHSHRRVQIRHTVIAKLFGLQHGECRRTAGVAAEERGKDVYREEGV